MTYEKPEQPPPRMPRRSDASMVPRFFFWRAMASTAWGDTDSSALAGSSFGCGSCVCSGLDCVMVPCSLAGSARAAIRLLLAVVGDGALDGVLGEHRAVDLHGRKVQLFDNLGVLDGLGLVDGLSLDPLGGQRRARDGRAAAEGLELGVLDDAIVVDLDLQAHDVTAG